MCLCAYVNWGQLKVDRVEGDIFYQFFKYIHIHPACLSPYLPGYASQLSTPPIFLRLYMVANDILPCTGFLWCSYHLDHESKQNDMKYVRAVGCYREDMGTVNQNPNNDTENSVCHRVQRKGLGIWHQSYPNSKASEKMGDASRRQISYGWLPASILVSRKDFHSELEVN